MSLTPRKAASLLGAATLIATAMTSADLASASAAQPTGGPSFAALSPSQANALSSGKQERMVVVFDDQLTSLQANRAHQQARATKAASSRPRS